MKISECFPGYLKASELPQPVTIVIERVEQEMLGHGADAQSKPVLYAEGRKKGIVLSQTTGDQLTEILGTEETDAWLGKKVVAYNDPDVRFGTKKVGGIRFRAYVDPKPAEEDVGPVPF